MRKVFWCGAAVTVAAATAFYLATDWVGRQSSSLAGRGVDAAHRGGKGPFLGGPGYDRQYLSASSLAAVGETEVCAPPEPVPLAEVGPTEPPAAHWKQLPEMIELTVPPPILTEEALISATGLAGTPAPVARQQAPIFGEVGSAVEDSPACPKTMPYCTDDQTTPSTMPYAEDGEDREAPSDLRKQFLHAPPDEAGTEEESEGYREKDRPTCEEDRTYHYHYPGCPFPGACPYMGRSGPAPMVPSGAPSTERPGPASPPQPLPPDNSVDLQKIDPERRLWFRDLQVVTYQLAQPTTESGQSGPRQLKIDTLEFRPNDDARPDEFGRISY
jgi:hypothetical protein